MHLEYGTIHYAVSYESFVDAQTLQALKLRFSRHSEFHEDRS